MLARPNAERPLLVKYRQLFEGYKIGFQFGLYLTAKAILGNRISISESGLEHLPRHGPFVIAARHYHHLYDGAVMYARIRRRFSIFVALDWIDTRTVRFAMEALCKIAGWPVGLRATSSNPASAYRAAELQPYLRRALRDSVKVLERGHGLVVFPTGRPVIDPHGSNGTTAFASGLCSIVEQAQRNMAPIPIVPVGLAYRKLPDGYAVELRCGAPMYHVSRRDRPATLESLELRIAELSEERLDGASLPASFETIE